ncbi:Response regulator containing CheY-like receiver domain and AraC-type DNA-binding domain [Alteromonadaceae bacterium Bs31]|nr:Response regulator containing CheY-like receiver domain and AraC-type DNA-binding domain [Alteromonadaceae bacterium Bs31]
MKQIEIIKTYGQKRCLVVDDVPDIRATLKRILVDFGSRSVDTAGNAEEAIDLCQRHQYDIVISDYNLGTGKTGQQLLEELRFNGLLKNTALYVIITAESASQYVLHALEYQPDDYLSKPFNRDSLRPRLDQALLKNEALLEAKKALDLKKPARAVLACEKVLKNKGRYANDARKMLGELLIGLRQYDQALGVYQQLPEERRPLWAAIGIARVKFGLQQYQQAIDDLNGIIADNPRCVEAHDLLAQIYQADNNTAQAQQALIDAVKISPLSTERQREMGRVSHAAGDELAAVHAYRAALKHSRNSCHESPEDYLFLSRGLCQLIRDGNGEANRLTEETLDTLKAVEKRFGTQPVVKMHGKLLQADLAHLNKREEKAKKATEEALAIHSEMRFSAIQNTSTELSIECARAFMELGEYDAGEQLLQELARINEDPEIAVQIDKLLREPLTKEGVQYAAKLNKQGIGFYQQEQYDAAIEAFMNVLRELPNHVGLNLNLIQAIISKNKGKEISDAEVETIAHSFQRVGTIAPSSSYSGRYDYLTRQYQRLIKASV